MIEHHPVAVLIAVAFFGAVYYVAECAWWPFAPCGRCDGAGRFKPANRKVWRPCRRCKGSGARVRIGRRIWNYIARTRTDAKK